MAGHHLPRDFHPLLELFRSDQPDALRARAAAGLLRFAARKPFQPDLLAAWTEGVTARPAVLRALSIRGLAALHYAHALGEKELRALLTPRTEDRDTEVRIAALLALSALDPLAWAPKLHRQALAILEQGGSPDEAARLTARLMDMEADEPLRASLRQAAAAMANDHKEIEARLRAAAVLAELAFAGDGEAFRALRALAGNPLESLRAAALFHLDRRPSEETRGLLLAALEDDSQLVFEMALRSLDRAGDKDLAARLERLFHAAPPGDLRRRYRNAARTFTGRKLRPRRKKPG